MSFMPILISGGAIKSAGRTGRELPFVCSHAVDVILIMSGGLGGGDAWGSRVH